MLVLDTCAFIWLAAGTPMRPAAVAAIDAAAKVGEVLVPSIALWEVLLAARKRRLDLRGETPSAWMARALSIQGLRVEPLTDAMAIDAASLPGAIHDDPADCFIVATARALQSPLVTRDAKILRYGKDGHVETILC